MKYALVYGLIPGMIIILTMIIGFELAGPDSFVRTLWYGYLLMLVALTLVFVGIKRYRDIECGGVIRFGRAFLVGLGMAAFAGVTYVVIFEIYLAMTGNRLLEELIARSAQAERADLESMLLDPWQRIPLVFIELFPGGLLVAVVSAMLLRNPKVLPARNAKAGSETSVLT